MSITKICSIENCEKQGQIRQGLCSKHYWTLQKYGDALYKTKKMEFHGMHNTPEYTAWEGMKDRCYNKNRAKYRNHGGRGIKMCDEWKNSFLSFYRDMGERPSPKHSIDRIDNNGDYYKHNCRWADASTQNVNRRPSRSNKHGYKGVSANREKYKAEIAAFGNKIYIGVYDTVEDAAYMYDCFAITLHGDIAKLNFEYK